MFAWDEAKRQANLRKHHIDFRDAEKIFRGFTFSAEDTRAYGERRFLTLGLLEDQVVSVTHTERGEDIRIIPFARPRYEARHYFSQIVD
jgi:uncharacterized protein